MAHHCTGELDVIRKEAWSFYRTISGVRLCWELEEPRGPKGPQQRLVLDRRTETVLSRRAETVLNRRTDIWFNKRTQTVFTRRTEAVLSRRVATVSNTSVECLEARYSSDPHACS